MAAQISSKLAGLIALTSTTRPKRIRLTPEERAAKKAAEVHPGKRNQGESSSHNYRGYTCEKDEGGFWSSPGIVNPGRGAYRNLGKAINPRLKFATGRELHTLIDGLCHQDTLEVALLYLKGLGQEQGVNEEETPVGE